MDLETYQKLGLHEAFNDVRRDEVVNGRSNDEIMNAIGTPGDVCYHPCPEAFPGDDVPRGEVHRYEEWSETTVYPGTRRTVSVYVPPGHAEGNLGLVVFQDGDGYLDPNPSVDRAELTGIDRMLAEAANGSLRATAVFDTLIAARELDPLVGIFINPGRPENVPPAVFGEPPPVELGHHRGIEYDMCNERYVEFLQQDVIPWVTAELGLDISSDPAKRAICGVSSGGNCALNAAWHDPGAFGNVISHCGSFTNIRGADQYPYLIRSTERKPIKVFLQSGENDANIILGNWSLANKQVADALEFAGYDYRFEFGTGGHGLCHGGALFAETLRWLWPR